MASTSRGNNTKSSRCIVIDERCVSATACSRGTHKDRIPFSIDAILNSPHPTKPSGCMVRETEPILTPRRIVDPQGCALTSLEKFANSSLHDKERTETKEDADVNIHRRLAALQARLIHRKRRKARTCFNNEQIFELERRFLHQKYLSPSTRDELSQVLGLSGAQVITWFQNRRAKFRRELEELKSDVVHAKILDKKQIQTVYKNLDI